MARIKIVALVAHTDVVYKAQKTLLLAIDFFSRLVRGVEGTYANIVLPLERFSRSNLKTSKGYAASQTDLSCLCVVLLYYDEW